MLVHKKRSRVEAFPNELVVEDGDKKSRVVLFASGVSEKELKPQLKQIILDRRKKTNEETTLRQARELSSKERVKERSDAVANARTEVFGLASRKSDTAIDLQMDEAIFNAFQHAQFDSVVSLIRQGRNPNIARQYDQTTALMAAIYHGSIAIARELLQLGADPDFGDVHGNTPKSFAKTFHDPALGRQLLDLLNEYEFVYDVYVVDQDVEAETDNVPLYSLNGGSMMSYDETTGKFIEFAHDEDDEFGKFDGDDSDSNESGYYEKRMLDEDDDFSGDEDEEHCAYGKCRLKPSSDDDESRDDDAMDCE